MAPKGRHNGRLGSMQNQGVPQPLPSSFYRRDPLEVARDLLGKKLVREYAGQRLEGVITEVEAYFGDGDTGSHASRGQTARNTVMFGEPGRAYVYLVYGMYWMLNVVTSPSGVAGAVLIRAIRPVRGRDRKSTRLNSSHVRISYAVFCLKKKNHTNLTIVVILLTIIDAR